MPVFKTFFRIAQKRFAGALLYLVIFSSILIIMSMYTGENNEKNFEVSSLDICVIDKDNSIASLALTKYLSQSHNIVNLNTEDKNVLQDNLYYQNVDYILTIKEDFEKKLLFGKTDNLLLHSRLFNSTSSYFAGQQIDGYISTLTLYLNGGYDMKTALDKTSSELSKSESTEIINFENRQTSDSYNIFFFFQYIPYIMISMMITGLAPILITLKKKDINSRINCSSMTLHARNFQITSGCIIYGIALWLVFIILGGIFSGWKIMFNEKGLLCILNSIVFLCICIAITLFVSTFSLTDNILNMIANVVGLGMSFLCGIFVPQWLLGDNVLLVARFLPAYWYIKANNMLAGFSRESMSYPVFYTCIGIQLLFFAAIFGIYLVASKQRKIRG